MDVKPINVPTWKNNRLGGDRFSKRLDQFLTLEKLLLEVEKIHSWVDVGGGIRPYYHPYLDR